ncbi:MAG: hypothetical protein IJ308_08995 [Clostridia bacterium]|nr:hypothetical protein [Clostridia bacterium]
MKNITLYPKDIRYVVCTRKIFMEIDLVDENGEYIATATSNEAYKNLYEAIKYTLILNEDGIIDIVNHKILPLGSIVEDSPAYVHYEIEYDFFDYLHYMPSDSN